MQKTCLGIFIVIILFLEFGGPLYAQVTDPNTIKLKSFTPAPTKTPFPTRIPTATPAAIPSTPVGIPTAGSGSIPGANPACFQSNRGLASDCAVVGKNLQVPKPRYLKDTSLCKDAYMYPYYNPGFVPPDMVDLRTAIGNEFWVKQASMPFNKCKVDDLKRMLRDIERSYRCVTFVGYGYRSFAEQEGLYNTYRSCLSGRSPGPCKQAAPPGRSLHQAGIALDLFCARMSGTALILENIPDAFTGRAGQFNFNRPLPNEDPPHFNGL